MSHMTKVLDLGGPPTSYFYKVTMPDGRWAFVETYNSELAIRLAAKDLKVEWPVMVLATAERLFES
jgi:hypothetical protein